MRRSVDAILRSGVYKFFLAWHALATLSALFIGLMSGDYSLGLPLLIWSVVVAVFYYLELSPYVLVAVGLAALEEFLIYSFGGGLQGRAVSLVHDYVNSLPVFAGIFLALYIVQKLFDTTEAEIYVIAGIVGSFVELVFTGIIFNPLLLFLLGGPNFFIYGSIAVCPARIEGQRNFSWTAKILSLFLVLLLMLFGAIIAHDMNAALGFPAV